MRIAGTACVVPSPTVVVCSNQVEPRASRAKFGKRTASMRPCASSSELTGSSSNAISTTGARGPLAGCLRRLGGEREPRDVRVEQEQREKEQRRRGEHRQREPGRAGAQVELGRGGADRDGGGHEQPAGSARAADRLQHEQRHEAGDEDGVHGPAQVPAEQTLEPEQDRGRHEQEHEREHDRVPAGRAAGGEELAVLAEQVEERLRDRERPEHEQVQAGQPPRQGLWPRHVLGPAR